MSGFNLEVFLRNEIDLNGPLTVEAFHRHCLWHPQGGYYHTQTVLGSRGDFVTAPEVSGLFGEVVGALCVHEWQERLGKPKSFSLLELGPGRGTLMADVLKVAQLRPLFLQGVQIHLLEINPHLRAQQATALAPFNRPTRWITALEEMADTPGPLLVLANEFFDIFAPQHWIVSPSSCPRARTIQWQDSPEGGAFCLSPLKSGDVIQEKSPTREAFFSELLALLKTKGGMIWMADYGYLETSEGETWQGLYQGRHSSPLEHVGRTDLTAHVDFSRLVTLAEHFEVTPPLTQRAFLLKNGLAERLMILRQRATREECAEAEAAFMRLTHPLQMGDLFKVMEVRA